MYDALLEALKAGNTAIPCSDFRDRFEDLCQVDPAKGKSKLQEQFEVRMVLKGIQESQKLIFECGINCVQNL